MRVINLIIIFVCLALLICITQCKYQEPFYGAASTYTNSQSYKNQAQNQTSSNTGMILGIVLGILFLSACIAYIIYKWLTTSNTNVNTAQRLVRPAQGAWV